MIEKGDKVRFIDEALEGTVASLIGKDRAEVITNDGFSTIALLKQLVKVRSEGEEKGMSKQTVFIPPPKQVEEPKQLKKISGKIFPFDEANLKEEVVYAVFEAIEPESPMKSAMQLHLVNNTSLTIAFSLSRKFEMRDEGIGLDKMEPRSVKSFLTYTQEDLKLFESFRMQLIFHPAGKGTFRPPLQKQFKFVLDNLLESQDFMTGQTNCLFIQIADLKQAPEVDITPLMNKFSETVKEEDTGSNSKKAKSQRNTKHIVFAQEKIVDLHIEELIKDFTAMSNGQIIAHQLKHFQYEMDQAIVNHLSMITFIHGVGSGVLKSAIREELKKYNNIKFGDAPVGKFGYGATEIIF